MAYACPVCSFTCSSVTVLESHVDAHFQQPDPSLSEANYVLCPLGCGQYVHASEIDSHEAVHRLQDAEASQEELTALRSAGAGLPTPQHTQSSDAILIDVEGSLPFSTHSRNAGSSAQHSDRKPSRSIHEENLVLCPIGCGQWIPQCDLDTHELLHQLSAQEELAAAAESDGIHVSIDHELRQLQEQADFEALQAKYGFSKKRPGKCFTCGVEGHWSPDCPKNPRAMSHKAAGPLSTVPAELLQQQRRDELFTSEGGLVELIAGCLEAQASPGYSAFLCGHVEHFCGQYHDRSWGCGWRNIQMVASHLMQRSHALREALFNGSGFIPDIGSLQAWLEVAWAAGFDPLGCESLGGKIQGDQKWIGTTEAAALLRYFRVQAHIVDFMGHTNSSGCTIQTTPDGRPCHMHVECDVCHMSPILGRRFKSRRLANYDVCEACAGSAEAAAGAPYEDITAAGNIGDSMPAGVSKSRSSAASVAPPDGSIASDDAHAASTSAALPPGPVTNATSATQLQQQQHVHWPLVEWVWRYFSGGHGDTQHMHPPVTGSAMVQCTTLPPLYLQHEGHSRTIIGIERRPIAPPANNKRAGSKSTKASPRNGTITQFFAAPAAADAGLSSAAGSTQASSRGQQQQQRQQQQLQQQAVQHDGYIYTLLVLDPGVPRSILEQSLRQRKQWQKHLRRGLHTFNKPQYQLMYVLDALAALHDWEDLKAIRAKEVIWPA